MALPAAARANGNGNDCTRTITAAVHAAQGIRSRRRDGTETDFAVRQSKCAARNGCRRDLRVGEWFLVLRYTSYDGCRPVEGAMPKPDTAKRLCRSRAIGKPTLWVGKATLSVGMLTLR